MAFLKLPGETIKLVQFSGVRYYTDGFVKAPSVTTILRETRSAYNKQFLAKFNETNGEYTKMCADRGTRLHKEIEDYLVKRIPNSNISEDLKPFFKNVKPLLNKLDPLFLELPLIHKEYLYGGTADCGAVYGGESGIPLLIDWKTSDKPKNSWYDYPLQLAAYIKAFNSLYAELCGVTLSSAMLVCVHPAGVQIEIFGSNQVEHYWNKFLVRLRQYYDKYSVEKENIA